MIPILSCYAVAGALLAVAIIGLLMIPEREPPPPYSSMGE